jgi:hypothetical protein
MKKSIFTAMAVATLVTILFSGTSSAGNKSSNKSTYNHSGNSTGIKGYTPPSKFKRQHAKTPSRDWKRRGLLAVDTCAVSDQACAIKYPGFAHPSRYFVKYDKDSRTNICYFVTHDLGSFNIGPAC